MEPRLVVRSAVMQEPLGAETEVPILHSGVGFVNVRRAETKRARRRRMGVDLGVQGVVTTVTAGECRMGETRHVIQVRSASTKVLLEPNDTRQQWKGESAARFVYEGLPVAARYRPPAAATGSPFLLLRTTSAYGEKCSFGGDSLSVYDA